MLTQACVELVEPNATLHPYPMREHWLTAYLLTVNPLSHCRESEYQPLGLHKPFQLDQ